MPIPDERPDDVGYMRRGQWALAMRADGTWEGSDKFPAMWIDHLNRVSKRTHHDVFLLVREMLRKIMDER